MNSHDSVFSNDTASIGSAKSKFHVKDSVCLQEETVLFGGMLLRYRLERLLRPDFCYLARVNFQGEEACEPLGLNLEFALDCFRMLVCGRVTPCTLGDVIRDWNYEERIF